MDFHLERSVRIRTDVEHKSLYRWALVEYDENGTALGRDQIPWGWSFYFDSTEVVLRESTSISNTAENADPADQPREVSRRRIIQARLRPSANGRGWHPRFRMFGTNRIIEDISLHILPVEDVSDREGCKAWGGVQFESEIDFRNEIQPDTIVFYLVISSSHFEQLSGQVRANSISNIMLRLALVSGFYSEWSPSISTSEVKILTRSEEHLVMGAEDVSFEVPRLGPIGEAELTILTKRVYVANQMEPEQDDRKEDPVISPPINRHDLNYDQHKSLKNSLDRLNSSTKWMIALLSALFVATILK